MTFRRKTLAVMTLLAAAGQAGAVVNNAQSGNGDLFVSIYNDVTDRSYTRDLGIRLTEFLPTGAIAPVDANPGTGTDYAFNPSANPGIGAGNVLTPGYRLVFGADSLLTSFLGSSGVLPANVMWSVTAGDSVGGAPGARNYLATSRSGESSVGNTVTGQLSNFGGGMDNYLASVNTLGTQPSPDVAGSNTAVPADSSAHVPVVYGFNFGSQATTFTTGALVDESQSFYRLQNGANSSARVTLTPYTDATWTLLSDGTLVYEVAAIPEPGTWALMIAGLLGVVGVARRRLQDPIA